MVCQSLVSAAVMASACRVGRPWSWRNGNSSRSHVRRRAAGQLDPLARPGAPGRRTRTPAATSASGRRPEHAPGTPRSAPPAGTPSAPARSPAGPACRAAAGCSRPRRPPPARRSPRVSPASARPTSARGAASPLRASAAVSARATTAAPVRRGQRRPAARAGRRRSGATSVELEQLPRQLGGRHTEQRPRPGRGQPELDARAGAVVVDLRRARRAAPRPSTTASRALAAVAPSPRPAAPPPAARRSGSSSAARGAPRARPGRRRTPPAR